jgi:exodeoxyribonuclease V alpha subunit
MSAQLPMAPHATAWERFEREDLKRNPSRYPALLRELERRAVSFHLEPHAVALAAELTSLCPYLSDEEQAALTLLTLSTLVDLSRGSTRTPADGPRAYAHLRRIYQSLSPEAAQPLLHISRGFLDRGAAPEVIGRTPDAYTPLLYLNGYLYHQRLYAAEGHLSARLRARLGQPSGLPAARAREAVAEVKAGGARGGAPLTLSDEQLNAVALALSARVSLISGGPGTGKTSIVVALLRAFARLGLSGGAVCLAAPTGKAAWRMGESIREGLAALSDAHPADATLKAAPPTPQTLHRLLGYHPIHGTFRHHPNSPLEASVVMVDESSMIDVGLMERLLGATREETLIVLLGDADQLPSVGAGAVFRDLLDATPQARARLTRSYRMREDNPAGRAILQFAAQICAGEEVWGEGGLRSPWVQQSTRPEELSYAGVSLLPCALSEQWRFLDRWAERFVYGGERVRALRARTWRLEGPRVAEADQEALSELFDHLGQARVLCLTQSLDAGVSRVNQRFHARFAKQVGVEAPFLVGEPLMMLHNDYDRMLFNGDQGLVLWVGVSGRRAPMAVFPELGGGFKAYELDALAGRVEHCYAMTVHKSQGSEFDHVALLLPPQRLPLLSKELIYTAVTRSRASVTLVGDGSLLSLRALNHTPRSSGLVERLGGGA